MRGTQIPWGWKASVHAHVFTGEQMPASQTTWGLLSRSDEEPSSQRFPSSPKDPPLTSGHPRPQTLPVQSGLGSAALESDVRTPPG